MLLNRVNAALCMYCFSGIRAVVCASVPVLRFQFRWLDQRAAVNAPGCRGDDTGHDFGRTEGFSRVRDLCHVERSETTVCVTGSRILRCRSE